MNTQSYRSSRDPLQKLQQEMKLRNFSTQTIDTYTYYIRECLRFASVSPRDITGDMVREYLEYIVDAGKSASTVNVAYSELFFYFGKILHRKFFVHIPRVKKEKKLPIVLSQQEVKQMINGITNKKYHTMVSLLYGTGMRVREVQQLRMRHIDLERGVIHIVQSKGKKDRIVMIPQKLIPVLTG